MALTDTLDDLITDRRIEPQLAIKILANFDRSITEILSEKVKAKLHFKVLYTTRISLVMSSLRTLTELKFSLMCFSIYKNTGPSPYLSLLR